MIDTNLQLRNNEDFYFIINEQNITSKSRCTIMSPENKIRIFFKGVIYNNTKDSILKGFIEKGVDFVKEVEGSYVIFLVSGLSFSILTDKVNSKKAFIAKENQSWHISNNIDLLPNHIKQLSKDGLACYLANGVMYNNLTIFKNIYSTERASVTKFLDGKVSVNFYWFYHFQYPKKEYFNQSQEMKELEKLLINSVKRRYIPQKSTALSLSGGFDSRGILGILNSINATGINCISYANDDNTNDEDDAKIAVKLDFQRLYS